MKLASLRTITATAGALAVVAGLGAPAAADTIEVTFNSVSPNQSVRYSIDAGNSFDSTLGGTFNWTRTNGTYTGGGAVGDFSSFCIELTEFVSPTGSYTYDIVEVEDAPSSFFGGMGSVRAGKLARLFGQFHQETWTANEAAAFQVAVWEITHDDDGSVYTGTFQVSGSEAYIADAQSLIDNIDPNGDRATILAMVGDDQQDHVFLVPAPGALALFGMGGALMLGRRRRA
ncbi:MAG: PEP-CTERM sorting domain-containing protein [Phycisphaerales bacterium]